MPLTEMHVFNVVRRHLSAMGATVVQLVPPGGQAPYSITFHDSVRRRTCYPDALIVLDRVIIVGEMKPRFSAADYQKVVDLLVFADTEIRQIIGRVLGESVSAYSIKGVLCHGQANASSVPLLDQWVVGSDGATLYAVEASR